jgi:hypothetical protein
VTAHWEVERESFYRRRRGRRKRCSGARRRSEAVWEGALRVQALDGKRVTLTLPAGPSFLTYFRDTWVVPYVGTRPKGRLKVRCVGFSRPYGTWLAVRLSSQHWKCWATFSRPYGTGEAAWPPSQHWKCWATVILSLRDERPNDVADAPFRRSLR